MRVAVPGPSEMSSLDILDDILAGGRKFKELSKASVNVSGDNEAEQVTGDEDTHDAVRRLIELKSSLTSCDEVLARIQTYMETFQADLLTVTSDIESLQSRSTEMSRRLQNRKDLEALLGPAIEESILSPQLIRRIIEEPVDKHWLTALDSLEQFGENENRSNVINASFPTQEVEKLRTVAIVRIRDYLVTKIKSLRMPKSNVQIIQQSGLLRMRKVFEFLDKHHPVLSEEIMQAYCLTMKWYYQTSFEKYQRSLSRITIRDISRQELLGAEDIPRSLGNMFTAAPAAKPSASVVPVLQLGTRAKYLHDNTSGIILAHLAETEKEQYFLERVFRSYIVALVENAAVEYLFMNEFFSPKGGRQVGIQFTKLFENLLSTAIGFVKSIIADSLDAIGLLTCIRVCQKLSFDLQKRKVAGLESFLDGLQITLWPRLQSVMDAHTQAVQKAAVSVSSVNESARLKQALPISKKFSDLLFAILNLSKSSREDEPVLHSLDRLTHDFESSLTRMAATCTPKLRNAFLFRNYVHISEQIEATSGPLSEKYKNLFMQSVNSFRT